MTHISMLQWSKRLPAGLKPNRFQLTGESGKFFSRFKMEEDLGLNGRNEELVGQHKFCCSRTMSAGEINTRKSNKII